MATAHRNTGRRPLTSEQSAALAQRQVSVALSAGAGCGKTFVLTERFLSQLAPDQRGRAPARLHELVAITFTDKAAREMRDRIRQACHQRLLAAEGPQQATYWRELLREMDAARISTIHSFCTGLLRTYAVEAALDPRFAMLEEAQAATLLRESLDDTLRGRLSDHDETVIDLLVRFDLKRLRDRLTGLLGACPPAELAAWSQLDPAEIVARWEQFFEAETVPAVVRRFAAEPMVGTMLDRLARGGPPAQGVAERFGRLQELLSGLERSDTPLADAIEAGGLARVQGGKKFSAWEDPAAYVDFKNAAAEFRERTKSLTALQFSPAGAREAALVGQQMTRLALAVHQTYVARKAAQGALDFEDLLRRAHALLTDPDRPHVRQSVAAGIRLLLVDEFQDTDPVQVEIIAALCGDRLERGKLFFVGDAKQSIYRFRGADPRVFRNLRERIPAAGRLPLTENFRSQPAILDFVNALFCDDLGANYESLSARRAQVTPMPAIEFLWVTPETATGGEQDGADDAREEKQVDALRRREAQWIARRLREIIDAQTPLVADRQAGDAAAACRPVRPGDVALLFRTLSDVEFYETALRDAGLPYYLVGGHAFYSQQEIFDLLNLLRAVSSACDDVSLVGALRSPFFSLADETLLWLSQHPQGLRGGLEAARLPTELSAAEAQRVRFAARTLAQLRQEKDRLPIAGLIRLALDLTGYDALLLAEFMGERKLANLHKLIEQARSFDQSGAFGLPDFLVQLGEFVARQPREALAASHAESSDVVRLMTIHQAKGLEFPLVVVPDLARGQQHQGDGAGYAPQLGPVIQFDKEDRESFGCTGYEMLVESQRDEEQAERLRLFYVAATRAADYLLLSAGCKSLDAPAGAWMELLARRFDLRTGQCCAAPPPEVVPDIRVTLEPPPAIRVERTRRTSLEKLADAIDTSLEGGRGAWPRRALPVPPDFAARRRFSFSQLSGRLAPAAPVEAQDEPFSVDLAEVALARRGTGPAAASRRNEISARALGTLVHAVLERLDFAAPGDCHGELHQLAERWLRELDAAQRPELTAAAGDQIERFLKHPRAAALAAARQRQAELPFVLAWPPGPGRGADADAEPAYLEGVIDCLYQDGAGDWHVLDFKTNDVPASGVADAARPYQLQLGIYALAVETLLGASPRSLTLHFLSPGVECQLPWNDAQRQATLAEATAAIARLRQSDR